ncbi:MAG TPA: sigma-70 family RNA polymerase sigma factor, partial [Gemmataceae bacterium]|nr:sigma-70 family RNA polymerase sigma factor [Gemmataceae bacterium]
TIVQSTAALPATDAQLLACFVADRDEAAFASLVRQHGPMVLGVCRRVLHDLHAAEDAFQATFLVLARKAGSIRKPELLANWLYGVAYRTALKAKCTAAKRQARERQVVNMTAAVREESSRDDLRLLLDEELSRLPDKYRLPIVLCGLEGKTNEEAARQLGCPRETIATRLARGRERLRLRLTRRGLALSALVLAGELSPSLAAPVSAPLAAATVHAGLAFATQATTAVGVSATVLSLTEGVLKSMYYAKLKMILAALLTLTIATTGIGLFLLRGDQPEKQNTKKTAADAKAIVGTWKVVSAMKGGKEPPDADDVKKTPWTISAEKIIVKRGDELRESSYKLNPAKKPKHIDVTPLTGPEDEKGKVFQGIYVLDRDSLKICISGPGQERPTEFGAYGTYQFELRRDTGK